MLNWSTPIDSSSRSFSVHLLGVAEHAEAVADLVGDELAVRGADAAVVLVVVELPRLDEVGQRARDLVGVVAVALDQVHDVVRDHRREPAHLLARLGDVVGDVARRADDALERGRVAARLLGGLAGGVHDPLDDLRVGELDDHAVADAAGDGRAPSARSRRPTSGSSAAPCAPTSSFELLLVPLDRPAVHQVLDHRAAALELGDLDRLQADDAARGVAAADAHHHRGRSRCPASSRTSSP